MAMVKKELSKNKKKWGPNSVYSGFYYVPVDEGYVDEYTEKVMDYQNQQLDPLKYDLADWINRTLGNHYISGETFLDDLDNGTLLCLLAQVIKAKAKLAIASGLIKTPLPIMGKKYFENAMSGSFFARDNVENFIKFCRSVGIHQNLLFESDDLVLHKQSRNVILCLLEVARVATRYGIEPPNLIQLEKEIIEEEKSLPIEAEIGTQLCWQFQSLPSRFDCESLPSTSHTPPPITETHNSQNLNTKQLVAYQNIIEENDFNSLPQISTVELDQNSVKRIINDDSYICFGTKLVNESNKSFDDLDKKVEQAVHLLYLNCRCANRRYLKLKIKKIGEGKYTIAGRNFFVKLLNNRHMVVRVGGGWDTLDHYLRRYDPCQADGKEYKPSFVPRPSMVSLMPNILKRYTYYSAFKKILRPGESAI